MSEKSRLHRTRKEIIYSIKTQQQGRSIPCQGFEIGDVMVFYGRPNGAIENENAGPINLHPPPSPHDFGGKGKYQAPEFIWFQTVLQQHLSFSILQNLENNIKMICLLEITTTAIFIVLN